MRHLSPKTFDIKCVTSKRPKRAECAFFLVLGLKLSQKYPLFVLCIKTLICTHVHTKLLLEIVAHQGGDVFLIHIPCVVGYSK
jgi:hypothetical protein